MESLTGKRIHFLIQKISAEEPFTANTAHFSKLLMSSKQKKRKTTEKETGKKTKEERKQKTVSRKRTRAITEALRQKLEKAEFSRKQKGGLGLRKSQEKGKAEVGKSKEEKDISEEEKLSSLLQPHDLTNEERLTLWSNHVLHSIYLENCRKANISFHPEDGYGSDEIPPPLPSGSTSLD